MGVFLNVLMACSGKRPQNLGAQGGLLAACPQSPNCVTSQAADEGHRIPALAFRGDPDAALARLKLVLGRRNDTTVIGEAADYLRVEFRTTLFIDDGEFLLDRPNHAIQVRSASRLGYSDLGKNRSRLEEIRRQYLAAEGNQ